MTPQELREELKNLEGNPQVIARRKQMQRDLSVPRLSEVETHSDSVKSVRAAVEKSVGVAVQLPPQPLPQHEDFLKKPPTQADRLTPRNTSRTPQ
jgi:hypothetical protein